MGKPTYTATPCVRIEIRDPDAVNCTHDDERAARLICRFHAWRTKRHIYAVERTSGGSAWYYYGDFEPDDAERIQRWLDGELAK